MDNEKVNILLADTSIFLDSAESDFNKKEYSTYKDYLIECNKIIKGLKGEGLIDDMNVLSEVPPDQRGISRAGAPDEIAKLREIINTLKKILRRNKDLIKHEKSNFIDSHFLLETIFRNFHTVARQLRNRYNSRPTLEIEDEYDVQDLLRGLLKLHFEDIRPEEHTPSYAGGSKRIDFLLKEEKTLIEVKKTRKNLTDKEIGEQLIIDISCYSVHPDCSKLYCFVYDPEGRIGNPIGLENDLKKLSKEGLEIFTMIYPK